MEVHVRCSVSFVILRFARSSLTLFTMSLLRSTRVAGSSLRTASRGFATSAIRRDHFLNASDGEFKARCIDDKSDKPVLVDFYAT